MKRPAALLGSAAFLAAAPGLVAGLAPWAITQWRMRPAFFGLDALRAGGWVLIALGAAILLDAFLRFAWGGRGTPAPIAPTETLVVSGPYRFVRNPMYLAVIALIAGQSLVFASAALLAYALCVGVAFHIFVLVYEEPTLRARYGAGYDDFASAVPRWLPRWTPWRSPP